MQTSLQFGATSTLQEWNSFRKSLTKEKKDVSPLNLGLSGSENFILHLTRQLEGESILRENEEVIPMFSEDLKQAS
jgi:hypothetical protein